MSIRQAEVIAAGVITLVGIFFMVFSIPIYTISIGAEPGGGVYPLWVGLLLALCGLAYLWTALHSKKSGQFITAGREQRLWLWECAISMAVYVWAMPYLGFTLATFLLVAFHLWVIGRYRARFWIPFALASALAIGWFFGIWLYMPLPRGFIGW